MQSSVLNVRAAPEAFERSPTIELEIDELRAAVNRRLRALAPSACANQDLLGEAIHSALLPSGKRLRPLCMVFAARDLGYRGAAIVDLGCALEMVHTASLLLDDLPCMDDASLRRGAPATHIRFGESTAVLAAIAMLSRAFELVSTVNGVGSDVRAHLVGLLAGAVGTRGLVGGQFYDLQQQETAEPTQHLASTHHLKTGALFVAAVEMVSAVTGASPAQARALRVYATELGRAFQLLDDILDSASSAEALGKDVGQDIGKVTLGRVLGTDGARARLSAHLAAMDDALHAVDGGTGSLRALTHLVFKNIPA